MIESGLISEVTERENRPFDDIIARYKQAINRQLYRKERQNRDFFTKNEQRAIEFYNESFTN